MTAEIAAALAWPPLGDDLVDAEEALIAKTSGAGVGWYSCYIPLGITDAVPGGWYAPVRT